jgi:hypothetical protein
MKKDFVHQFAAKCRKCGDVIYSRQSSEEVYCGCKTIGIKEGKRYLRVFGDIENAIIRDVREKPGYKARFNNEESRVQKERLRKMLEDSDICWLNYAIPYYDLFCSERYVISRGIDLVDGTASAMEPTYQDLLNSLPELIEQRILFMFLTNGDIRTSIIQKQEEIGDLIRFTTENSVYAFDRIKLDH